MLEHIVGYNRLLVVGMFVWIPSIVFLPFPTELLSAATQGGQSAHALHIGTMLTTSAGVLIQERTIVVRPELEAEDHRGESGIAEAVILVVLITMIFVVAVILPAIGLWSLLILLLSRPLLAFARTQHWGIAAPGANLGTEVRSRCEAVIHRAAPRRHPRNSRLGKVFLRIT